jgi:DNA (cytosine-5)-methyltransferase 1
MKILNLYAGIGGNRKLWGNEHNITAVEWDKEIAAIYQDFYPNDTVIVADAHQFLLDHYKEYDFIWSSPPCPSHSLMRMCRVYSSQSEAKYPDMKLYEEIIFLKHFAPCNWIVENVKPYYQPLIIPVMIDRHCFWSNLLIPKAQFETKRETNLCCITGGGSNYGFTLKGYSIKHRKDQILRNLVNPDIGKYLLDIAMATPFKIEQEELFFEPSTRRTGTMTG